MTRTIAGVLFVALCGLASGQTKPPHPVFDAASLKPGDGTFVPGVSGRMKGGPGTADPGRITYPQARLADLLMKAWNVPWYQIAAPAWLNPGGRSNSWTINATMPPETTKDQFQLMFQNLLIERFRIRLHHETRNLIGYELTVAPGGSKLKPTTQDPDAPELSPQTGAGADGFSLLPPGHAGGVLMTGGGTRFKCQSYTMAEFVPGYLTAFISGAFGPDFGPVIDKTGLKGKYDFTLEFDSRDGGAALVVSPNIQLPAAGAQSDPGGYPGLLSALEKQLGLKLTKVKEVPVDVLVIDQMEKTPTEN